MISIGYIYATAKLIEEDKVFLRLAREAGVKIILFPAAKFLSFERMKNLAKKCDIVLNNSAEPEALEMAKTVEAAGARVLDPTNSLYFFENKWMFYVHCRKHNIPTPKTYLLPQLLPQCYKPVELLIKKTGYVIIKNIMTSNGNFVDRAKTIKQAIEIIKKFRKKDGAPLIAQEYIKEAHRVYRVMVLDGKITQGVIKKSKNWKCTGRFAKHEATFSVSPKLKQMCLKISKILKIPWCGIDLMRRSGKWVALEANATPGMDFIGGQTKELYQNLIQYLISSAKDKDSIFNFFKLR